MTAMVRQTIGEALKGFREAEGLSVRKAAANADMDATVLSRIEHGHRLPTAVQLAILAKLYGQPLESLLIINTYTEIKQKYGQTEHFSETVHMLYEDSGSYAKC